VVEMLSWGLVGGVKEREKGIRDTWFLVGRVVCVHYFIYIRQRSLVFFLNFNTSFMSVSSNTDVNCTARDRKCR